jgi:ankyrin repeat protein
MNNPPSPLRLLWRDRLTNFLCLSLLLLGATALGMDHTNEKLDQELLNAARHGNLEEAQRLIKEGASVEAKNNYGLTLLMLAAREGHEDVCKLLIDSKASVEAKDNHGRTLLNLVIAYGNENVMKLLIANRASVEVHDNFGWTPLMCAARFGEEAMCRFLIAQGASVQANNNQGGISLSLAALHGHEAVCKLLIDVQLNPAKAAIATFLGIARKRYENLPCQMQYDVAKMIGHQGFQLAKWPVLKQINLIENIEKKAKWLEYVNTNEFTN